MSGSPKNYDSQQLSLFDFAEFNASAREESGQLSFMPHSQLSQQVIDEALCIDANDKNSRLIICAYFMKDHTPEENAAFLAKHYGTNGAGFISTSASIPFGMEMKVSAFLTVNLPNAVMPPC